MAIPVCLFVLRSLFPLRAIHFILWRNEFMCSLGHSHSGITVELDPVVIIILRWIIHLFHFDFLDWEILWVNGKC